MRSAWAGRVLLAALGAAAAALVIGATSRYGAGLSTDSAAYVAAARHLVRGEGYRRYEGGPLIEFGPAYPTVLAAPALLGVDPLDSARFANALAFGAVVVLAGLWLRRATSSLPFALAGAVAVLLSPALFHAATFLWSEAFFVLWLTGFLLAEGRLARGGGRGAFFCAVCLAALAALTRYIGGIAVLWGAVSASVRGGGAPSQRLGRGIAFAALAGAPLALWLARNLVVASSPTGGRGASALSPAENAAALLEVISSWLVGRPDATGLAITVVVLAAAPAAGASVRALRGGRDPSALAEVAIPSGFFVVYAAALVALASVVAFDRIGGRLASPLYVPLVLALVGGVAQLCAAIPALAVRRVVALVLTLVFAGWVSLRVEQTARIVPVLRVKGAGGYASARYQHSALLVRLKDDAPAGVLYSNDPGAVYLLTGRRVSWSPRQYLHRAPDAPTDELRELEARVKAGEEAVLLWLRHIAKGHLHPFADLEARFDLEELDGEKSASLYRLRAR